MYQKRNLESEEKATARRLVNTIRNSATRQNETEEETLYRRAKNAKRQKISTHERKTSKKKYTWKNLMLL